MHLNAIIRETHIVHDIGACFLHKRREGIIVKHAIKLLDIPKL